MSIILPLKNKKSVSFITLISSIVFFLVAHFNSNFSKENPKPNSLVYYVDYDNKEAYWKTYDQILDDWSKPYFDNTNQGVKNKEIPFESKYNTTFKHTAKAKYHEIPLAKIHHKTENNQHSIQVQPLEVAHRISFFNLNNSPIDSLKINNKKLSYLNDYKNNKNRLLTYYVVDRQPIEVNIFSKETLDIQVITSSYTLFKSNKLDVKTRSDNFIPKPFVLNDAIIQKRTIHF
jgi:hypothetical protein